MLCCDYVLHKSLRYTGGMISVPEDYGLGPRETLQHTASASQPEFFDAYWQAFREEVAALPLRFHGSLDGEVNPVTLTSIRSVRIAARITMPPVSVKPSGIVITTHGYAPEAFFPNGPEPWTDQGLITVRLRVRGFAPSTIDMPDFGAQWILHKIEAAESWILRGAVADLIHTCRCARARWPMLPLFVHGESFGGGLAVISAAQLAAMSEPPDRLVLALPSLGDWSWRAGRYCNGAGALVNAMLNSFRQEAHRLMQTLLLFDAALHARSVTMPALCKLACRDDCVPAPAAASVYNALASNEKWLFATYFGHFDGGLADVRRHVMFEKLHRSFLDPAHPPAWTFKQNQGFDWLEPLRMGAEQIAEARTTSS